MRRCVCRLKSPLERLRHCPRFSASLGERVALERILLYALMLSLSTMEWIRNPSASKASPIWRDVSPTILFRLSAGRRVDRRRSAQPGKRSAIGWKPAGAFWIAQMTSPTSIARNWSSFSLPEVARVKVATPSYLTCSKVTTAELSFQDHIDELGSRPRCSSSTRRSLETCACTPASTCRSAGRDIGLHIEATNYFLGAVIIGLSRYPSEMRFPSASRTYPANAAR